MVRPQSSEQHGQHNKLAHLIASPKRALAEYWAGSYDWRRCEAMLNRFGLYETQIDGLLIRFLHVRSESSLALPLLLTHGWPGSIIEFHKVIEPLVAAVDPARD